MSAKHLDMRLATFVDFGIIVFKSVRQCGFIRSSGLHRTTPDRTYLAATKQAATDDTVVQLHVRDIHIAVAHVAAAKDTAATFLQFTVTGSIVNLLHIGVGG